MDLLANKVFYPVNRIKPNETQLLTIFVLKLAAISFTLRNLSVAAD